MTISSGPAFSGRIGALSFNFNMTVFRPPVVPGVPQGLGLLGLLPLLVHLSLRLRSESRRTSATTERNGVRSG
ncbi:MAG: hypothetical protein SGPRY_010972, partial [Prymnesium sp.]